MILIGQDNIGLELIFHCLRSIMDEQTTAPLPPTKRASSQFKKINKYIHIDIFTRIAMELCHSARIEYYLQVYMLESDRNRMQKHSIKLNSNIHFCAQTNGRARAPPRSSFIELACALYLRISNSSQHKPIYIYVIMLICSARKRIDSSLRMRTRQNIFDMLV